jgi:predicted Zn-dependent protease
MRRAYGILAMGLAILALAVSALGQGGRGRGRLTGTVFDDRGNPVAGAKVVLRLVEPGDARYGGWSWKPNRGDTALFETATDSKGGWVFQGLATGLWEVRASKGLNYGWGERRIQVYQTRDNPKVEIRLDGLRAGSSGIEPGRLDRANAHYAKGEFGPALDAYREYLEEDADAILVALAVGVCLTELGRLDEAAKAFQDAVVRTSEDPADKEICALAYAGLAESYFKSGDLDRALEGWKRAAAKTEVNEIFAENVGEILFARGRAEEALEYLGSAARLAPRRAEILYKLGLVQLKLNDRPAAEASFAAVVAIGPRTRLGREAKKMIADLAREKPRRP